jgi:hypothetical protein
MKTCPQECEEMKTRRKVALDGYSPLFERLFAAGADTSWERYERELPQNRLAATGYFCPNGCLDGPCHVDPFGKGPELGVCGRTAQEMSASWLLWTLTKGFIRRVTEVRDEEGMPVPVPVEVSRLVVLTAHFRLDAAEVRDAILAAARAVLEIEASAPQARPPVAGHVRCGLGARNPLKPAVLLDGLDCESAVEFAKAFEATGIECVVTGDERVGFSSGLPVLCPSSLAGVVGTAGGVDAVIVGKRSHARISSEEFSGAAQVFLADGLQVSNVVPAARKHFSAVPPVFAMGQVAQWDRYDTPRTGYLILAGGLGVKKTCGEDTAAIARLAQDSGFRVSATGDAAAVLGAMGLMMSEDNKDGAVPGDNPAGLGWRFSHFLERKPSRPVIAAFPEAVRATDLAAAFELAALGIPTYFGAVLPIWGPRLGEALGWMAPGGLPLFTYDEEKSIDCVWTDLLNAVKVMGER